MPSQNPHPGPFGQLVPSGPWPGTGRQECCLNIETAAAGSRNNIEDGRHGQSEPIGLGGVVLVDFANGRIGDGGEQPKPVKLTVHTVWRSGQPASDFGRLG